MSGSLVPGTEVSEVLGDSSKFFAIESFCFAGLVR